jgi:hypothetical protein
LEKGRKLRIFFLLFVLCFSFDLWAQEEIQSSLPDEEERIDREFDVNGDRDSQSKPVVEQKKKSKPSNQNPVDDNIAPSRPALTEEEERLDREFNVGDPSETADDDVEDNVIEQKPSVRPQIRKPLPKPVAEPRQPPTAPPYHRPMIQAGTVNVGGGEKIIKVPHPNSAKGLIRINKDGSYQYRIKVKEKSQATTFNMAAITSPTISNILTPAVTYNSMYGTNLYGLVINYEWMPFRKLGTFGMIFESGISSARGRGRLEDGNPAEETFNLFVIPMTAMLKYRFEYFKRQWFVPYILGVGTYYGLLELRDDNQRTLAGSAAVGGGGGIHFNVTRWDPEGAFRLDTEWGITDMWLTLELRVMKGLKPEIDFTSTTLQAGITVDY